MHDNIRLYHADHLGSTSLVTDIDGEITQHVAYIPYGEIFVEQRNGSWASPYLFNAKELDEETGLYYYGARYLDPTGVRWLSVDPLFEMYVGASPYNYCHGNPIALIDPVGMDEYEIDGTGYVKRIVENKEKDIVYSVDKQGKRINSVEFKFGTIEKSYSKKNDKGYDIHIIQMRGDDNATQLFEFLANPDNFGPNRERKNVEWGLTLTGEKGEKGLNFLTTSHNRRTERGFMDLYKNRLKYGYTIRRHSHNHPSNTPYPSGLYDGTKDMGVAAYVSFHSGDNVLFSIYTAKNKSYIQYNQHSQPEDFFPSELLPSVTVSANLR